MNKNLRKAAAIGIAGMTAFSSISGGVVSNLSIYAEEVVQLSNETISAINKAVGNLETKLTMSKGKYLYDSDNKKLLLSADTTFELLVGNVDKASVSASKGKVSTEDDRTFVLSELDSSTELSIKGGDSDEKVKLADYLTLAFPDLESVVFLNAPVLKDVSITHTGKGVDGYLKDNVVSVHMKHEIDEDLSISDYTLKATYNDIEVDLSADGAYSIDGDILTVKIDLSESELYKIAGTEGEYKAVVSIEDKLGQSSKVEEAVCVDYKAPKVSNSGTKWVNGSDGKIYIKSSEEGSASINFKLSDATGVASIDVNGSGGVVGPDDDGVYTLSISEGDDVKLTVEDKLGNKADYTLSDILGCNANEFVCGLPLPAFEYSLNDKDWHKGPSVDLKVDIKNAVGGILNISYVVGTGEEVSKEVKDTTFSITEDLVKYVNDEGIVPIKILVEDNNGNIFEENKEFKVDNVAPQIKDIAVSNADSVNIHYKTGYTAKDLVISGSQYDAESGIKSIEVLDGDKVVATSLPYTVSESGKYSVKVTDNAENSTTYTLQDLVGKDFEDLVVSKKGPVISEFTLPEGGHDINGVYWYSSAGDVTVTVDSDNLDSTKVYAMNGDETISVNSETSDNKTYKLSAPGLKEGINTIFFSATNRTGLSAEKSVNIGIDTSKPVVQGIALDTSFKDIDGSLWFNKVPTATVTAKDSLSKVTSYVVLNKNGEERVEDSNTFKLKAGDYAVKAIDVVGNASDVLTIQKALGTDGEYISVDNEKPVIKLSKLSEGSLVDGWYSKDVSISANAEDNMGIHSIEMYINGTSVAKEVNKEGDVKIISLSGVTSKVDPNEDGSFNIKVVSVDNAGNVSESVDTVYVDKTAPKIEKFVVTSDKGYKEGSEINGSDKYGFYLDGATNVEIHVTDGKISSGMDKVHYTLVNKDGGEKSGTVNIENGVATVKIPNDFKGFISAYATDIVGNKGKVNKPDGIITEDGNIHVNTSKVKMVTPDTKYTDVSGHSLYGGDIKIKLNTANSTSGIRKVEWGIGEETKGTINVDSEGNIDGGTVSVIKKDKNLILSIEELLKVGENANNIKVWVKVTDRVGHVSENSRTVSIDKDVPVINVSYNNNLESGHYKEDRVATVRITERNFNKNLVKFSGNLGKIGDWKNIEGDIWETTVSFNKNGEYTWGIGCTDRAGNVAKEYNSGSFIVDKVAPELKVSFDNNDVKNSMYYNKGRTATVEITEKYFDSKLVKLEGNGAISGWKHDGDKHTATITFDKDGEYDFALVATDLSGNVSNRYSSGKFIIDTSKPKMEIAGVNSGVSYKKEASFKVLFSDRYLDKEVCSAKLVGRTVGNIDLKVSIDEQTGQYVFAGLPNKIKWDDYYTLNVKVADKAGNISEENLSFSINRFGSQYKFLNEHLLGNIIGKPSDVDLQETSVDKLDVENCKVVVIRDGDIIKVNKKYVTVKESGGNGGPWVYNYHIAKEAFSVDGKYQIQVYSKAKDGTDYSSLKQEYFFLLDTTNPEIIISGVEDGKFYKGVSRKATVDVRDLSGVKDIVVKVNGKKVDVQEENGVYFIEVDESSDRQNMKVTVEDKAGNKQSAQVSDFMVSSSTLQSMVNSPLFKWGAGAVGALAAGLVGLTLRRRKGVKSKEKSNAIETAKLYEESNTGGSSSGK